MERVSNTLAVMLQHLVTDERPPSPQSVLRDHSVRYRSV